MVSSPNVAADFTKGMLASKQLDFFSEKEQKIFLSERHFTVPVSEEVSHKSNESFVK